MTTLGGEWIVSEEEYVSYVVQYSDMVLRIAVNYCKELPDAARGA